MRLMPWLGSATLVATSVLMVSAAGPVSAAEGQPALVEDHAYPDAERILAEHGLTVHSGDGHILFVTSRTYDEGQCAAGQIQVEKSLEAEPYAVYYCFRPLGARGWLTLTIPGTFGVRGGDTPVRATADLPDGQATYDVPPNSYVAISPGTGGEPPQAVLVELRLTGAQPATAAPDTFAAKLDIGAGWRSCSGALIAAQWVATAASCFAEAGQPLSRGRPARPTTATVGRTNVASGAGQTTAVVELVPRADRDLVLAKLIRPISGITPPKIAATAPAAGEVLHLAGYGRTATEWAPDVLHTADFTAGPATATTFAATPVDASQPSTCKGDAGGPAFRDQAGTVELVAIHSTSWRGGCLAETETRRDATEVRLDDVAGWIAQTALGFAPAVSWTSNGARVDVFRVKAGAVQRRFWTGPAGWSTWVDLGAPASGVASAPAATWTANGSRVDVLLTGADGHLYQKYWTGAGWIGWVDLGATPMIAPAASWTGNGSRLEIFGVGADGRLHQKYWTSTGWTAATFDLPAAGAADTPTVTWTTSGSRLDVYVTGFDGHLYQKYWTGTGWRTWLDLGGNLLSAPSASWTNNGGRIDIFGVGADGHLHQKYWTSTGWTTATFAPPAAGLGSPPNVSWTSNGTRLEVVTTGRTDGHVYQKYWTSTGWSPWVDLG